MHIFCSFCGKITIRLDKNNIYWQPIPKNKTLLHLRIWCNGADFRTKAKKILMQEQCIPLEGIMKMI